MIKKDLCPPWKAETLAVRLDNCRIMLAVHRVLSDVEAARVRKRTNKLVRAKESS